MEFKSLKIADTTEEERRRIVDESIGHIDGLCDGCSCGVLQMYDAYIYGHKELAEINAEYRARFMNNDD